MSNKDTGLSDAWEKAKILLEPVGGLCTAVAVAFLTIYGSCTLENLRSKDTNARLYTELMSKREEAESALRKDMFNFIIRSFLKTDTSKDPDLESMVLELELLAYNFHESLNLKPLFSHLHNQISLVRPSNGQDYLKRLKRVATEITGKQMMVLEEVGKTKDKRVDFAQVKDGGLPLEPIELTLAGIDRYFQIIIKKIDLEKQELSVRLEVITPEQPELISKSAEFTVSFFDFPFIDNIRLTNDQRCALVLRSFDSQAAEITAIYFPGSYASLREKPYIQEIVQNLVRTQEEFSTKKKSNGIKD